MATALSERHLDWPAGGFYHPSGSAADNAMPGAKPAQGCTAAKILIAEDMPSIAWLLFEILAEAGYEIIGPAATISAAAELAAQSNIDAALLDISLVDGLSFPLAESLAARGIPFAFLTGYGSGDLPLRYRGRPILGKPMSLSAVLKVTKALCAAKLSGPPI